MRETCTPFLWRNNHKVRLNCVQLSCVEPRHILHLICAAPSLLASACSVAVQCGVKHSVLDKYPVMICLEHVSNSVHACSVGMVSMHLKSSFSLRILHAYMLHVQVEL